MNYMKIRSFCITFRVVVGVVLIAIGLYTSNMWFYLGIIPLIAGLTKFCPLCTLTKKCEI